jgi:hypothetical protein
MPLIILIIIFKMILKNYKNCLFKIIFNFIYFIYSNLSLIKFKFYFNLEFILPSL